MNRRRTIANNSTTFVVLPLVIPRLMLLLGAHRGQFVDRNAIKGKTVDPRHYRWAVGIHAGDLNHDPPAIIAMIGMQLVLVLLFGIDAGRRVRVRVLLPTVLLLLHRRDRKKQADSQRVHHRQAGSRGAMNPGGSGKIERIRGTVARTP